MKITWLGQAGLLFEKDGVCVMIDPYLSDYVEKVEPKNYRRVPVNEAFLGIDPDVMIFTHNHLDHYDPETAPGFFRRSQKTMSVLGPESVRLRSKKDIGGHNFIAVEPGTSVTLHGLRFTALPAWHSDPYAIGFLIEDTAEGKVYYVTGDTLFNYRILRDPILRGTDVDVLFLPVNGVGNNMNATDAARFAQAVGARTVVPLHVGMFDDLSPNILPCENKVIPVIWEEIRI